MKNSNIAIYFTSMSGKVIWPISKHAHIYVHVQCSLLHSLLLYGVVCHMQDKNEAAETFFEAATSFEPRNILAWTMLGEFSCFTCCKELYVTKLHKKFFVFGFFFFKTS